MVFITVYLVMALVQGEAQFAVFEQQELCVEAVSGARERGVQVTDCMPVEMPRPFSKPKGDA